MEIHVKPRKNRLKFHVITWKIIKKAVFFLMDLFIFIIKNMNSYSYNRPMIVVVQIDMVINIAIIYDKLLCLDILYLLSSDAQTNNTNSTNILLTIIRR